MVTLTTTFGNLSRTIATVISKQKPAVGALNHNNQFRNCYNINRIQMLSSAITRTIAAVMSKHKPVVGASKYNNQSQNCYYDNHIRMLSHSKEMVSSAIARAKIMKADNKVTEQFIENTSNNTVMDDYSENKADGIEVFVKALERENVTHITYFMRNKYVRDFIKVVSRSKVIDLEGTDMEMFAYYTATGFANADQGHEDRPGVCCISTDSALIVDDVFVKRGERGPVVVILVPYDKDGYSNSLRFNNDACMSLPHYFRILDVGDITTVVQQAFSFAYNEPAGPVYIDIQHLVLDHIDHEEDVRTEAEIVVNYLDQFCPSLILYVSSSLNDGAEQQKMELSRFLELTGIQVTHSLVGLDDAKVLYAGATCSDLREIAAMNQRNLVFLVDVGDEEEMQKFIKPRGHLTTFPTFKEINEILVAKGIRFDDDFSCWGRLYLEIQRQREDVLANCYADIISTGTANNNKRITQEFAICVLDEFFEENKEKVMVYRKDNDQCFLRYGAEIARPGKDVYVVIDGFEKGKVLNRYTYGCECVIIVDNTGWTKRFYQETRKLFIENFETFRKFHFDDDASGDNDYFFEERVVGEVVTDKCDLKNALYQYHESPMRYKTWLVVAVVPPADRFVEEEIPNFSRDLRFYSYPSAYLWKLADRSPPTPNPSI